MLFPVDLLVLGDARTVKATAYIVESGREPDLNLIDTVKNAGFSVIEPFSGLSTVERRMAETPICFFLFTHTRDTEPLRRVVHQVRSCKRRNVRFSPLIYFCQNPSQELIANCLSLGFDDVITLPQKAAQIGNRLNFQLNKPIVYFETPHYFGPDRRREPRPQSDGSHKSQLGASHQRFEFVRAEDGIAIKTRQAIAA